MARRADTDVLLAMVVFTTEHRALFAAIGGLLQFANVARDFISPYKHRRSAGRDAPARLVADLD